MMKTTSLFWTLALAGLVFMASCSSTRQSQPTTSTGMTSTTTTNYSK